MNVPTSVEQIVSDIRARARSNSERGSLFEKLMLGFLTTDSVYADRFSQVWLWKDWPGRAGRPDTGIDLVAEERDGSGLCAIQCKFYEQGHSLQKPDIDSFLASSSKSVFAGRMIISTTEDWNKNAEDAIAGQHPPVNRIGLAELTDSSVDWDAVWPRIGLQIDLASFHRKARKQLRPHQADAVGAVLEGFADGHDRGKLIMACGTGKTFTALKTAERIAADKLASDSAEPTRILFLLPSIALLSQTLREWADNAEVPMRPFAVCSDAKATSRANDDTGDLATHDLALPSTTDPEVLAARVAAAGIGAGEMMVVFSTYQSISVIAAAQGLGLDNFDLIVCDEAHRTTGVTLAGADESHFVKVHDATYLHGARRLYMTATPRLYSESTQQQAKDNDAVLCSMDDEALYGPEFYRLGFGKAVELGLLTDYKVIVLAVNEEHVSATFQAQLADANNELNLDDACKIVGCWNALSKRSGRTAEGAAGFAPGEAPMRRAVAFAANIKASQLITNLFSDTVDTCRQTDGEGVVCEVRHVDGNMNALVRNQKLAWLKQEPKGENICRILTNARCLSEGVDVPSLDAVLFLSPRNSMVDVVQSVGRVMRKAEGKEYGYIILPVAVPAGASPDRALSDNKRFAVVWQVLQALRAHDERFNAMVNQIELNKTPPSNLMIMTVGDEQEAAEHNAQQLAIPVAEWTGAILAKVVAKVGERHYWERWASDIARIAERHVARIKAALLDPPKQSEFAAFLKELQNTINPGVDEQQAIDMLAQHLITKPVFDALFAGYDFSENNPVSKAMQGMLAILEDQAIGKEAETLEEFYDSVRRRAEGVNDHEGRQKVVTELYERFFKTALPKTADALGIVYTPIEVVDFILRATDQALHKYWGQGMTAEGVQIIDPFTGTGTFIVRLLQSGLIKPEDLLRKYTRELHANEILLLAYYIAAINIEAAFHNRLRSEQLGNADAYVPFEGIVLTDTFQLTEANQPDLVAQLLDGNHERAAKQKALDIRVVIGNPPYSVGQGSQNDNNQNQRYPVLDSRIEDTFAALSAATNKKALYDSYIRAIRWASDRVRDEGAVCFVSNGGYIDGKTADGLRKALFNEFDFIYCYNLRGNQRSANWRKEGGKIFGSGSQNTVAILLLIKGVATDRNSCELYYHEIGDSLSREEKLALLTQQDLDTIDWSRVTPNVQGDWIKHRSESSGAHAPLADDKQYTGRAIFKSRAQGVTTSRDLWVYNYSRQRLEDNIRTTISAYNERVSALQALVSNNGIAEISDDLIKEHTSEGQAGISWSRGLKRKLAKREAITFQADRIVTASYRPFCKQHLYFDRSLVEVVSKMPRVFPGVDRANFGFYVTGAGSNKMFSVLAVDCALDIAYWGSSSGQFFPRYTYHEDESEADQSSLLDFGESRDATGRVDNISDEALADFRKTYGPDVTTDDIFFYCYGILHSPEYRSQFSIDLDKSLPPIPKSRNFREISDAGRRLASLHIGYENVEPFPFKVELGPRAGSLAAEDLYCVEKMQYASKQDKSSIIYNRHITLSGIPEEAHRYLLASESRSAIDWVLDRYQVKTDKSSGIVNDPNEWSAEAGNPRYIIDLLARIVTISVETMRIVDSLPSLELLG